MSVTKLAIRHMGQSLQSAYRECSSIQRKISQRKRTILNLAFHHEKDLFISFMTENSCKLQCSHCQDRLKLRHIGIQCNFFHFTYSKTLKEDNGLLHICLFVQTDYRQLKKTEQNRLKKERFGKQGPEQVAFIPNSCSVCFRRKHVDVQVQDTSVFNQTFLWKSAIRCTMNICHCGFAVDWRTGKLIFFWGITYDNIDCASPWQKT